MFEKATMEGSIDNAEYKKRKEKKERVENLLCMWEIYIIYS
jgi:hypothetical protein